MTGDTAQAVLYVLVTTEKVKLWPFLHSFRKEPDLVSLKYLPEGTAKMAANWLDLPRRTFALL